MLLHNSLNKLHKNRKNSGFTLVELLISSFMGVIIIGAAGFGLVHLLRGSRSNTAQVNKRTEFNRATEFISDEMRRADTIELDPSTAFADISNPPANAQPVLAINIPGVSRPGVTGDSPIVYFVSEPASKDTSIWNGPRVIYRYGPPSDENGIFTAGAWQTEPLVDGISADTVTPACDTGWTASPAANAVGFYACILPTSDSTGAMTTKGETAKIFAIGQLDETNYNSDNYQVSTQVYARAEAEDLDGSDPNESYDGFCTLIGGVFTCPPGNRTYSIDRLSDSFACKPDGTKWKVKVTAYYLDDNDLDGNGNPKEKYFQLIDSNGNTTTTTSQNVDLETTNLDFTSDKNPLFRVVPDRQNSPGCTGSGVFSATTQNQNAIDSTSADATIPQFKLLQDADLIPDELKNAAYGVTDNNKAQKTVVEILGENNLIDSIQNSKVNTGQDYLVAFEIGQTTKYLPDDGDPTTPLRPNPGYDFQDQIFKVNVK